LARENERLVARHDRASEAAAPVQHRPAARPVAGNRMQTERPGEDTYPVAQDTTYQPTHGKGGGQPGPVEEAHPHRKGFAAWRQHARG
jgi:hypothetical protein